MVSFFPLVVWLILGSIDSTATQCDNETQSSNVTMSWSCGGGPRHKVSCGSLGNALDFTANVCQSEPNVTVFLNSNQSLGYNSSRNFIKNFTYFGLIGADGVKTVSCIDGGGLHFEGNGARIEIKNMSFEYCGNKTAALMFSNILDISLNQITVAHSNGSGLLFDNVIGQVNVSYSSFNENLLHNICGGGVYISNEVLSEIDVGTRFSFVHCHFRRNHHIEDMDGEIDGGGMYISVSTNNVSIEILDCYFVTNRAKWGAGLFIGIYGGAYNNSIMVSSSHFEGNFYKNFTIDTKNVYNAGGGVLATTTGNSSRNNVSLVNCNFTKNAATWGGGLALYAAPNKSVENVEINKYFVIDCKFYQNIGAIGSAVNIYCKPVASAPGFCNAIPYIKGKNILQNNGRGISKDSRASATTLDINGFTTRVISNASLLFITNDGTPLCIRTTALVVGRNTHMEFDSNTAETGGGLALYDAWLTLDSGCRFLFHNNTAFAEGGAIYAQQSANLYVPHIHNCFLRFVNDSLHPGKWDCKFNFSRNKAGYSVNSIYATSIIPCVWRDQKLTFCWQNWTYDNTCDGQIKTSIKNFSNTSSSVRLFPGIPKAFIAGVDDLGNIVKNLSVIPTLWPRAPHGVRVKYNDDGLIIYAKRNTKNLSVLIQFDGDRNIFKVVSVDVGGCPPGFGFFKDLKTCRCYENMRNVLQCGRSWNTSLLNGYCMTYSNVKHYTPQTVYGRCVFSNTHTNTSAKYIPLPEDELNLNSQFCGQFKRKGILCGKCLEDYSIDVFSTTYDCRNCSSSGEDWIIFVAVNGLPPLVLFLAMLMLHISFTSGSLNGFIFFSHVVTLSQEALVIVGVINMNMNHSMRGFFDSLVDFFSIWSLDNFRIYHTLSNSPVCLGEHLRVIDVLALHYLSALYPFLLIVVAYIIIELHARNCRLLVWLWKPLCFPCTRLRRSWKLQASVVDAFASFIILSYVKLVRISLLLLTFTTVTSLGGDEPKIVTYVNNYDPTVEYFSRQHIPFVFLGGFFLVLFGILTPALLIFYQCSLVQRCLNHCKMNRVELKTFVEVFQGCYKDGRNGGPDRRFFAGLYLIFRVVIFFIYNLQVDHTISYYCLVIFSIVIICLLAWLRPYKVKFYNNLDIFFSALLAAFFGIHILGYFYLETTLKIPFAVIFTGAFIGFIPVLYLIGLICVKLLGRFCHVHLRRFSGRMLVLNHRTEEDDEEEEMTVSKQKCVTYSEVDPRQLVNSTLYEDEGVKASEGDGLLSRGRESGYSSITH